MHGSKGVTIRFESGDDPSVAVSAQWPSLSHQCGSQTSPKSDIRGGAISESSVAIRESSVSHHSHLAKVEDIRGGDEI